MTLAVGKMFTYNLLSFPQPRFQAFILLFLAVGVVGSSSPTTPRERNGQRPELRSFFPLAVVGDEVLIHHLGPW